MTNKQPQQGYAIGMAGLGVIRRNLMLNMAKQGACACFTCLSLIG